MKTLREYINESAAGSIKKRCYAICEKHDGKTFDLSKDGIKMNYYDGKPGFDVQSVSLYGDDAEMLISKKENGKLGEYSFYFDFKADKDREFGAKNEKEYEKILTDMNVPAVLDVIERQL